MRLRVQGFLQSRDYCESLEYHRLMEQRRV
jgi:hypothetical protein